MPLPKTLIPCGLAVCLFGSVSPATGSEPPPTPAARPLPDCSSPEHKRLGMLIGSWMVRDAPGELVGHNQLLPVFGSCAVREEWTSSGDMRGTSLTFYDSQLGHYHQVWIDNLGVVLDLTGGFEGDQLVLSGERPSVREPGVMVRHVIRWQPQDNGTLRQLWSASKDEGRTWMQLFDGKYVRDPDSRPDSAPHAQKPR